MRFFFFKILLIFIPLKSFEAKEFPQIFGCFCEGGVISGKIKESDSLFIDQNKIEIFENGEFIFAFGRKFKEKLKIRYNSIIKEFSIKNKKYKIEKIKGLPQRKVEPNKKDLEKIFSDQKKIKNSKKIGSKIKLFDKKFILPVEGRISGVFGSQRILNDKPKRPHFGIDIAQKIGAEIKAPSSGIVKLVSENMFFTGNTVILDHGLGLISIFAHLESINVEEGQNVSINEKIGTVGMTGRATGPHLHWGVYLKDTPVDPMSLINFEFF
jgi:murein DD-endopeptidase MepM/ murein hydrolase activator NlpD